MTTPTSGTVRDIRTGRAVRHTTDLTTEFIDHMIVLRDAGTELYVVTGPCRHTEMRWAVNRMREHGITVVYDKQFPSDRMYLFEGRPDELGFAV